MTILHPVLILDSEDADLFTHSCQDWGSSSRLVPGLEQLKIEVERLA